MTYIVTEPCVGVKDESCIAVCPVDCIYAPDDDGVNTMVFINPEECIDCGACVPECPVNAIFVEDDTPEEWKTWIPVNYEYFTMERGEFLAKFSELMDEAKDKNKTSEYANPVLYS